jgi:glycosyltransferase involved in cell wall biosynthesis
MFSVIIPCYKNPDYLRLCLKSIVEGQIGQNEIIVVLDGFIDQYVGFDKEFPSVNFLPLQENRGMATALNIGVYNASNSRIIICNDDNLFPNEWNTNKQLGFYLNNQLDKIVTINQIEPLTGSMFGFPAANCGTVDSFNFNRFNTFANELYKEIETLDGRIFPFIINKVDYLKVGGFNNGWYDSPQIVDWDFFLKLELCKMQFIRTHRCHLYHFGSTATVKGPEASIFREKERKAADAYRYMWSINPTNGINNTKLPSESLVNGIRFK